MSILRIGSEQSPLGLRRPREWDDAPAFRKGSGQRQEAAESPPVNRAETTRGAQEYQRLTALHNRFAAVATTIRTMDQATEAIGAMLSALKSEGDGPVKDFPPFPPGSEERAQHLREYAGLRVLLDKLALSPEGGAATPTVQTGDEPEPLLDRWTYTIEPDGHARTVLREEIAAGHPGSRPPDSPAPGADRGLDRGAEIRYLEEAGARLHARRQELLEQTVGIAGASSGGEAEETAATARSGLVRRDLAALSIGLAHGVSVQWEQLLG